MDSLLSMLRSSLTGILYAGRNLLQEPRVAIRVAEPGILDASWIGDYLADLAATRAERLPHLPNVRHNQEQPPDRARLHRVKLLHACADDNRAARPRRRELHDAPDIRLHVMVEVEADAVGVEVDGSVDIRDRQHHDFQLH